MIAAPDPCNGLLAALPREDWQAIRPVFEEVSLPRGATLRNAGEPVGRLHFPLSGVVSAVAAFENGQVVEMATVGREGVVEIGAILGGDVALSRHVVQVPATALTVRYSDFRRFQDTVPAFRRILSCYAQTYVEQVSLSVACNAAHALQERLARWLLTCHDRNDGDTFMLTQEFLAEMLGVTRPVVNSAARRFQDGRLIAYTRGSVTILDRSGLEQAACECYGQMRRSFERLSIAFGFRC